MTEVFTDDVIYDVTDLGGDLLAGLAALRRAAFALGEANPMAYHVTKIVLEPTDPDYVTAWSKGLGVMADSAVHQDVVTRAGTGPADHPPHDSRASETVDALTDGATSHRLSYSS